MDLWGTPTLGFGHGITGTKSAEIGALQSRLSCTSIISKRTEANANMDRQMAQLLFDRRDQAIQLDYVTPCPDDWEPIPHHCHENADRWVDEHPAWRVVRGWLIVLDDGVSALFDAHSVVRDPLGQLWDVTQSEVSRFVIHTGREDEFMKKVKSGLWVRVNHIPECGNPSWSSPASAD